MMPFTRVTPARTSSALSSSARAFSKRRLRLVPHADDRGQRIGRAEACAERRLALDPERVGPGQPAGAAHRPGVEQQARGEALARGGAAQHHHLAGEQRRRPARPRPRCGASAARPGRRWSPAAASRAMAPSPTVTATSMAQWLAARGGAIDLFRRLGGADGLAPGPTSIAIFEDIAAGHPARGGHQDGLRRFARLGLGEQNPAGIALIEVGQARLPRPARRRRHGFRRRRAAGGGRLVVIGHQVDRVGTEMSKAFTKESDGDDEDDLPEESAGCRLGAKNYMTPQGFARMREELDHAHAQGAARGGEGRDLGGRQRRPLGERRLHLRQEAAARDRPPRALSQQAAGQRRGGRSGPARPRPTRCSSAPP